MFISHRPKQNRKLSTFCNDFINRKFYNKYMQKNLTPQKKKILDFINLYTTKNRYSPSLEEIKKKLKLKSVSTIHQHLEELKEAGYIKRSKNKPRAIFSTKDKGNIEIPIIGTIAAGQPIETIEIPGETVTVPRADIRSWDKNYALRVRGDSMVDDGIFDGDMVIIREQKTAENGQMVVAIIDDGQATLKKLYHEKGRFRLQPANQTFLPLFRKELEIRGVVIRIIRNLINPSLLLILCQKN